MKKSSQNSSTFSQILFHRQSQKSPVAFSPHPLVFLDALTFCRKCSFWTHNKILTWKCLRIWYKLALCWVGTLGRNSSLASGITLEVFIWVCKIKRGHVSEDPVSQPHTLVPSSPQVKNDYCITNKPGLLEMNPREMPTLVPAEAQIPC